MYDKIIKYYVQFNAICILLFSYSVGCHILEQSNKVQHTNIIFDLIFILTCFFLGALVITAAAIIFYGAVIFLYTILWLCWEFLFKY